ncbi:MAG: chemotaxis protein CheB [Acidobacteria bacterium]|nr:chemotaxis protein CheB [Acidobacteriota bacterium]
MALVGEFPADFRAPVFIVLHIPPDSPTLLPQILSRRALLPVSGAVHGEKWKAGHIYIATPDHHLLLEADGTMRTVRGPRENRHRPAVDPLFRSAALVSGPNAIGVILSGNLDDGTAGLLAIKQRGGVAIVQDPNDALYPDMPLSALHNVPVDYKLPLSAIAAQIVESVNAPPRKRPRENGPAFGRMQLETRMAEMDSDAMEEDDRPGKPSAFSCPDCGGVLWEIEDDEFVRYRCRVGHAFSPETMLGAQDDVLEEALWTALKTLEESARLSDRLALTERGRGHEWMARRFDEKADEARTRAEAIRRFLVTQRESPSARGEQA